ncbi:MAG: GNAT family N-acetyltransferase [Oscillospiraceae bacterium]|nr:GNAT family N-acetyltransferase [Oscillospiraceae bacterium]
MLLREGIFTRMPTLETSRITLRRMTMADAQDVYRYSSDPEVAKYVLWDAHRNIQDSRAYIRYVQRQYRNDEPSSWGMILRNTQHLIGTIGFMWWNQENHSAEIGYSLARPYWNQGMTTEALAKVIEFGFDRMRLHRIEAQHCVENGASGRVMEKCGMTREGVLRGRLYSKGAFMDVVLYAILESDRRPAGRNA